MKYDDGYVLDENSKAIRCPKCDNEDILNEGNYCSICGVYLINQCTNEGNYDYNEPPCEALLPSNARYCHLCGVASTYFTNGLLVDWKNYKDKTATNDLFSVIDRFDEVAISIDDDAPF